DIKPIVEIPDISIFIYYGLVCLVLMIICIGVYFFYTFLKPKEKSLESTWYENLQKTDLNDTKNAAYTISKYGQLLAKDERQIRLFEELNEELSSYKYKKNITKELSPNIKNKYRIFLETLDVQ
ncbi:MAG: hypothetical protein WA945_07805, partial [Arcobacteraceae bacterium]